MQNTPDNTPSEELNAETHSNIELPSYDISPEDQELANEIANFDPVLDTNGPTQVGSGVMLPSTMKATGLPDHLRIPVMAQLANVPAHRRDEEEARLVGLALRQNSYELRVACGPGDGANAYQREFFLLEFERFEAGKEIDRLAARLGEVEENASVVTDPVTGQQRVETKHRVQGHERVQMEAAWRSAVHRLALLDGSEGERRMAKAKYEAVQEVKSLRDQFACDKEARAMADKMLRDEEIEARAKAYAKSKRATR